MRGWKNTEPILNHNTNRRDTNSNLQNSNYSDAAQTKHVNDDRIANSHIITTNSYYSYSRNTHSNHPKHGMTPSRIFIYQSIMPLIPLKARSPGLISYMLKYMLRLSFREAVEKVVVVSLLTLTPLARRVYLWTATSSYYYRNVLKDRFPLPTPVCYAVGNGLWGEVVGSKSFLHL